MNTRSKRKNLLEATSYLIEQNGMENLTLEAVAKQAGVSKGGLLYHFSSKEALIKEMINSYTEEFKEDIQKRVETTSLPNGKWHRAYLDASLNDSESANKLSAVYTASLLSNPLFLSIAKETFEEIYESLAKDELDPVDSAILRLAIDGLWYSEIFKIGKLDEALKEKVIERLNKHVIGDSQAFE